MIALRQGDRGPAVRELQLLLAMTGHDPGPIDGVFGPRTSRAMNAARIFLRTPEDVPEPLDPGVENALTAVESPALDGILGALDHVSDAELMEPRALPRRTVEVPRILTPITAVDMRIALVAGYVATGGCCGEAVCHGLGCQKTYNAVRVALAQLCVEHGCRPWSEGLVMRAHLPPPWLCPARGELAYQYTWNFNIGNRQVRREDRGFAQSGPEMPTVPWFSMSPVEGLGSSAHKATSAHYAYPNAAEGAAAYWRFLRDHCGPALAAFEAGDPGAAAHELKVGAWHYSGDEAEYTRAMVDRFRGIE